MFVPSLALVSQNRAPYACGGKEWSSLSAFLQHYHLDWKAQRTLANLSPCRALTQVPSGRCSRRSTLFPTTHIGILSSVESCRGTAEAETGSPSPVGLTRVTFAVTSYLNLIHPRSDAEKAALGRNVIEEQDSVSFTEIGPGDATKPIENTIFSFSSVFRFELPLFYLPLLARRVPYLQAGLLPIHKHALHLEVNSWTGK